MLRVACTGALVGVVDVEPPTADELTERGGAARKGPADTDRSGLPPGYLLLLTHHGALPQRVCFQGGPGNSPCTSGATQAVWTFRGATAGGLCAPPGGGVSA